MLNNLQSLHLILTKAIYLSVVKLPVNIDLSFSDVASQIRDRMGNVWKLQDSQFGNIFFALLSLLHCNHSIL